MPLLPVVLNSAGVRKLLQSSEIAADLERRGARIADAAGDGFEVETSTTPTRARVVVITDTSEAMLAEANDRALTRAVDAGRD